MGIHKGTQLLAQRFDFRGIGEIHDGQFRDE
jgi:hypothetical protein